MALAINDQTPAASPPAREALVRAVVGAPPGESEPTWIEWKGPVDDLRAWAARMAFYILGFANRMPDDAAHHMGGNGYLVLGAQPGTVHGVPRADTADLHQWVSPFLGAHGPQWDPHFIEIDGRDVLLIVVPPPRWGDPIFRVRKDWTHDPNFVMRDGEAIVRRLGRTTRASSAEQDRLDERAKGGVRHIDISLRDHSRPMTPVDLGTETMEAWLAAQRAELLHSVAPDPKPATMPGPTTVGEVLGLTGAAINRMMENLRAASSPEMLAGITGESRSREQYIAEVDDYIDRARQTWTKRVTIQATRHRLAVLELTIHNETDDNFSAVEVALSIAGRISAYFDPPSARLPSRPAPFGSMQRYSALSGLNVGPLLSPHLPGIQPPRGYIDNSGSTEITFAPVDLRPEEGWRLEPVYLVVGGEHAGEQLEASWKITSTSARGSSKGSFRVAVRPDVADPRELLARKLTEDEDDLDGNDL